MIVDKKCEICGKEFTVPHWRIDTAKYCSKECQHNSLKAKPNLVCPICGKSFHRKPFHINRCKGDLGYCCSKSCATKLMRVRMLGENNHQYGVKGDLNSSYKQGKIFSNNHNKIDVFIYIGDWYKKYNKSGRIPEHRYLVELNHLLYPSEYFEEIDGWYYLKGGLHIHHKDHNHDNNQLSNLEILTRGEHCRVHNLSNPRKRNKKGQFIKCK